MGGTVTITVPAAEWAALQAQVAELRIEVTHLNAYLLKRREMAVIEFRFVEKLKDLPLSKQSYHD